MRNGKHYVSVRLTKTEKEQFLRICKLCAIPECTVLYWLVNGMPIHERPPESFFKLNRLFLHIYLNLDHIWLSRENIPQPIRDKYHALSGQMRKTDRAIFSKAMFYGW